MSNSDKIFVSYSGCGAIDVSPVSHTGAVEITGSCSGIGLDCAKPSLPSSNFKMLGAHVKYDEEAHKFPKPKIVNDVKLYEAFNADCDNKAGEELDDGRIVVYGNLKFVVDATGSMAPFITGAKDQIFEIAKNHEKNLNEIYEKLFPEKKFKYYIRISVIGYRDYCDKVKLEVLPFTNDLSYVKYFLSNLHATGGGDQPEDMLSGFKAMIDNGGGENNQFTNNLVCLITDAPAHGSFMKDENISENGNYEHEKDQWITVLHKMKEMNHDFMVVKAGTSVNKSIEFIREHYDEKDKFSVVVKDLTVAHEQSGYVGFGGGEMLSAAIETAISGGSSESGIMYYTRNSGVGGGVSTAAMEKMLKGFDDLKVNSTTLNPQEYKSKTIKN
jgi:hypothetical protein